MLGAKAEEVAPPILFSFSDLIVGRGMKTTLGVCYVLSASVKSRGEARLIITWQSLPCHYLYTPVWCRANHRMNLHLYAVPGFHTPPHVRFRELVQKSLVFTWFWILRVTLGFSSTINRIGRI